MTTDSGQVPCRLHQLNEPLSPGPPFAGPPQISLFSNCRGFARAHFNHLQNTKIQRNIPQEREKIVAGDGEKRAKISAPHPSGATQRSLPSNLHLAGPPPEGFRASRHPPRPTPPWTAPFLPEEVLVSWGGEEGGPLGGGPKPATLARSHFLVCLPRSG